MEFNVVTKRKKIVAKIIELNPRITQRGVVEELGKIFTNPKTGEPFSLGTVNGDVRDVRQGEELQVPKPGYVYLVKERFMNLVKIGYTRNVEKRLCNLHCDCPQGIEVLHVFYTETPEYLESVLHRQFFGKCYTHEWFSLTDDDVQSIVSDYRDFALPQVEVEEVDKRSYFQMHLGLLNDDERLNTRTVQNNNERDS